MTALTVLAALLAVAYVVPGSAKLLAHPEMQTAAAHFGIPWSRYRLLGVAETAAAAGMLLGIKWPQLGVAAAGGMLVLLIGALVTHRRAGDSFRKAVPAVALLVLTTAYLAIALTHR